MFKVSSREPREEQGALQQVHARWGLDSLQVLQLVLAVVIIPHLLFLLSASQLASPASEQYKQ